MERPNKQDYNLDSTNDYDRFVSDQEKYINHLENKFLYIKPIILNGHSKYF